jgi:CheY-like chemotaxis protein
MAISRLSRTRIAVIDDDPSFLELMEELLALGEGYDVVSSANWPRSFEFVKATRPDLIILDLMMGREQCGRAVLELLRDDPSTYHIPVIVCSAAAPALLDQARGLRTKGAVETLAKPFELDHMLHLIRRLLASQATTPA